MPLLGPFVFIAGADSEIVPMKDGNIAPIVSTWSSPQSFCGTRFISAAPFEALRANGETLDNDLLAHIAPLGWQHVNLTGDYLWGQNARPSSRLEAVAAEI